MDLKNSADRAVALRLVVYALIIVGALAQIWQISGIYAERRENAKHRANLYAQSANSRIAQACTGISGPTLAECVLNQVEASREDERAEYELKAQQDSADAAFWMVVLSFAALVATLVALWFVKGTLDATRETVKETQRIGEAQVRAYLSIKTLGSGLHEDGRVWIKFSCNNSGQSPARSAKVEVSVAVLQRERWFTTATFGDLAGGATEEREIKFLIDEVTEMLIARNNDAAALTLDARYVDVFGRKQSDPTHFILGYDKGNFAFIGRGPD